GEIPLRVTYKSALPFNQTKIAPVMNESGQWGFIDNSGKEIIPPQYGKVTNFNGNPPVAVVRKGGVFLLINPDNEVIKRLDIIKAHATGINGNTPVQAQNQLWGVINAKGDYIIEPKYEVMGAFSDDGKLLFVSRGKRIGAINLKEEVVIPFIYTSGKYFIHNRAKVAVGEEKRYGVINTDNKAIIPFEYDSIDIIGLLIAAGKGDSITLFDHDGKKLADNLQKVSQHPGHKAVVVRTSFEKPRFYFFDYNGALKLVYDHPLEEKSSYTQPLDEEADALEE
ncbi:MAG: WG repeat-containing protein, partial [Victivallaceae bacterium]